VVVFPVINSHAAKGNQHNADPAAIRNTYAAPPSAFLVARFQPAWITAETSTKISAEVVTASPPSDEYSLLPIKSLLASGG
jgi:hypothetical protein